MRISSSMFFKTGVNTINSQQAGLMKLYQQIGTGKRMITPSDDPLAAAQTINIAQSQSLNARFTENRQVAKTALSTEENTLTSVTSLLQSIKTRLVEAGNGTLSDADRAVLGNVMANARENLLGLANATDGNGQYMFSGYKGNQPPFVEGADGKVVYQGDDGRRKIQVDQTRQLDSADTGREIFMQSASGTRNYVTAARTEPTPNAGNAVAGSPIITDVQGPYVGDSFNVVFAEDAVTGDLSYTVNRLDGNGNAVGPVSDPQPFTQNTSVLNIFDQVQVKISGIPADGDAFKVEPAFTPNTHAVTFNDTGATVGKPVVVDPDGTSVGLRLQIEVTEPTPGNFEYRVVDADNPAPDLKPAAAFAAPDLENGLLDIGGGMKVAFSGTPAAILPPATETTFVVEPVAGNPIANLNVFDALDNLIAALNDPAASDPSKAAAFSNQLNAAMQRVDVTYNQVLTVRSSVGTRLNEIASIDANASLRDLSYSQDLIRLEDLDWYEATAQLKQQTAALEAASLAFKQIQATSLFNLRQG